MFSSSRIDVLIIGGSRIAVDGRRSRVEASVVMWTGSRDDADTRPSRHPTYWAMCQPDKNVKVHSDQTAKMVKSRQKLLKSKVVLAVDGRKHTYFATTLGRKSIFRLIFTKLSTENLLINSGRV